MKRNLILVSIIILLVGIADTRKAKAAFDYHTFLASVTDGTTELLGGVDYSIYTGLDGNAISNYFNQDLLEFGQAGFFADLTYGGFGGNVTGDMLENYDIWVAVTDAADVLGNIPGWNGMTTVASIQNTAANTIGTGDVQPLSEAISVASGLRGSVADELDVFLSGQYSISLEAFDAWTAGTTISLAMDVVHYASTDWTGTWTVEDTGVDLVITRNVDGSISLSGFGLYVFEPSTIPATPIPPSAVLLCSAILVATLLHRRGGLSVFEYRG